MPDNTRKAMLLGATEGRRLPIIGHEITVKLAANDTAGGAYVFEDACPPGIGVPPHVHEREDEILTVLEGEYEIFLDGKTYTAQKGAVANFPRFVAHAFKNVGNRPARALFVVTPAESFAQFFEELSALPPNAPTVLICEVFARYGMAILQPQKA
jgi:quercetin dioxygenase-like cupin family protein